MIETSIDIKKLEVYLYQKPIDFRKQLNGLISVVVEELERQPNDGAIYVFRSRLKDKLKCLIWDRNGFWMCYKRLEKGHFDFPIDRTGTLTITANQLLQLIGGFPLIKRENVVFR